MQSRLSAELEPAEMVSYVATTVPEDALGGVDAGTEVSDKLACRMTYYAISAHLDG